MITLPRVAALELTYRCNHRCLFCSCPWEAEKIAPEDELETEVWACALHELARRGTEVASFSGGEPTLRNDLLDIIDAARREGMHACVVSNGRSVGRELLEEFSARDVSLSISVPGIMTFEQHTGHDGVEHVMQIFRWARDLGMRVTANIAVTKGNLPELRETMAYALINGASYVLLNRFLPGGRGLDNTALLLDRDELNQMLSVAESVLQKAGAYGHVGTELPYCAVDDPSSLQRLHVSYRCGAAKTFFAIDPSGYVKVCNHSEHRLCKVWDIDSLESDPYWQTFERGNYRPSMCDGCDHASTCDGGCREAANVCYGSADAPDPLFAAVRAV